VQSQRGLGLLNVHSREGKKTEEVSQEPGRISKETRKEMKERGAAAQKERKHARGGKQHVDEGAGDRRKKIDRMVIRKTGEERPDRGRTRSYRGEGGEPLRGGRMKDVRRKGGKRLDLKRQKSRRVNDPKREGAMRAQEGNRGRPKNRKQKEPGDAATTLTKTVDHIEATTC